MDAEQIFAKRDTPLVAAVSKHMLPDVVRIVLMYTNTRADMYYDFCHAVAASQFLPDWARWTTHLCTLVQFEVTACFLGVTQHQLNELMCGGDMGDAEYVEIVQVMQANMNLALDTANA